MKLKDKKRFIKMTMLEVAEEKNKKRQVKDVASKKHGERISNYERFIIFEAKDIPKFFDLSGPLTLYMYLRTSINRDPNASWANLGKYFQEGYLATARSQNWLAKTMGVSQQNISNWFSKLEALGYIEEIGKELIEVKDKREEKHLIEVTIYALGELVPINGYVEEVLYYEQ